MYRNNKSLFETKRVTRRLPVTLMTFGFILTVPGRPAPCRMLGVILNTDLTVTVYDPMRTASKRVALSLDTVRNFPTAQKAAVTAVLYKKSEMLKEYKAVLREVGATDTEAAAAQALAKAFRDPQ